MAWARTWPYYALTLVVGLGIGTATATADVPEYALPADPTTVVLSVDQLGGYEPPRIGDGPRIAVLADGRIRLGVRYEEEQAVEARLEAGELQALLRFALDDQHLLEFDEASVDARMRAEAGLGVNPLPVDDAPETVVEVRLADRAKTVRQTALDFAVLRYPSIPELARLKAVCERLENAMAIASMGGPEAATAFVQGIVNPRFGDADVQKDYPGIRPFGAEEGVRNLRLCAARSDGTRIYRIQRKPSGTPVDGYAFVSAQIVVPPSGPPASVIAAQPAS